MSKNNLEILVYHVSSVGHFPFCPHSHIRYTMLPTRPTVFTFLLTILLFASQSLAQSSSTPSTTPSAVSPVGTAAPTIVQTFGQSTHQGCYNETTNNAAAGDVRALAGGNMVSWLLFILYLCSIYSLLLQPYSSPVAN